MCIEGADLNAV
jgi:hypothetical protein